MELNTRRLAFDAELRKVCPNVYFQPPQNSKMKYPCIVYKRDIIENRPSDNLVYNQHCNYEVTVIDPNPDSIIVDRLSNLIKARHTRNFATEGLNHDVFKIYY